MNFKILLIIFVSHFGISSMTKFNITCAIAEGYYSNLLCFSVYYTLPRNYVLHTLSFLSQKPTYLKDFVYELAGIRNAININYKNELQHYIDHFSYDYTRICFNPKPPSFDTYIFSWEISVGPSDRVVDYDGLEFVYKLPNSHLSPPTIYMAQLQPPIPSKFKPLCVAIKYKISRIITSLTLETISHDLTSSILYDIFEDKMAFSPLNLVRLDVDEKESAPNMICFRVAGDIYKKVTALVWTIKDMSLQSQSFAIDLPSLAEEKSQPIISIDFSKNPAVLKQDICIKATVNSSSAFLLKLFSTPPRSNVSELLYHYNFKNKQFSFINNSLSDISLKKNLTSGTTACIANVSWQDAYRQFQWVVESYNNETNFYFPFSFDVIDEEIRPMIELVDQREFYDLGDDVDAICTYKGSSSPVKISWFVDNLLLNQETHTNYSMNYFSDKEDSSIITQQITHISLSRKILVYGTQTLTKYPRLICKAKTFSLEQADQMLTPIKDVKYRSTVKIREIIFEPATFDYNTPFCVSVSYSVQNDKVFDCQLIKKDFYFSVELIYRFYKDDNFQKRTIAPYSSLQQKIDYNKTQGNKVCFKGIQRTDEDTLLFWSVNTIKGYENRKEFYLMPNYTPPTAPPIVKTSSTRIPVKSSSTRVTDKPSFSRASEFFTPTLSYDNSTIFNKIDNSSIFNNEDNYLSLDNKDYMDIMSMVIGVVLALLFIVTPIMFYFTKLKKPKDQLNDILLASHK